MDIEAAMIALKKALGLLPPKLVMELLQTVVPNMGTLITIFPQLREILEPHVKAGMLAMTTGLVNTTEVLTAVNAVVGAYVAENLPAIQSSMAQNLPV